MKKTGRTGKEQLKTMRVLNFGSLNLDYVYTVNHFVKPGETLSCTSRTVKPGGKGLNQSVALARAGADTAHAGCLGKGGESLREVLKKNGVDVSALIPVEEMQGHTVIQVNPDGENSIILCGGSNQCITEKQISTTLEAFSPGDWLVLQNEINMLPEIVEQAYRRGMRIVLNPSPCNEKLEKVDFQKLSWLLINEVEAEQITGENDSEKTWKILHERYPHLSVLMTLGKKGSAAYAMTGNGVVSARCAAEKVRAVDTTAAGDTYTGFFLAGLMAGKPLEICMKEATKASAISVTRPGAADSIPWREEISL